MDAKRPTTSFVSASFLYAEVERDGTADWVAIEEPLEVRLDGERSA